MDDFHPTGPFGRKSQTKPEMPLIRQSGEYKKQQKMLKKEI